MAQKMKLKDVPEGQAFFLKGEGIRKVVTSAQQRVISDKPFLYVAPLVNGKPDTTRGYYVDQDTEVEMENFGRVD